MENTKKITLEMIEKLFKRWLIEENIINRAHLREGSILVNFNRLIKGGEPPTRLFYMYEGNQFYISLTEFYAYMNTFNTYTDFFTEHFDVFLTNRGLKKQFIYEVNRMTKKRNENEYSSWPVHLFCDKDIDTIEEYIEQRKDTGFLSYVMNSFSWVKAENKAISWARICSDWRRYIIGILIKNAKENEKN